MTVLGTTQASTKQYRKSICSIISRYSTGGIVKALLLGSTIVLANQLQAGEITLSWNDNSDNEDGFSIERAIEGGDFSELATVASNVTSYIDTTYDETITHSYRVRAFNSSGYSNYTNTATTTPVPPNTAPTISAIDDLSITEGDIVQAIEFSIADSQSNSSDLTISANSSNSSLLLDTNISIEGTADTRTVDLNPISGVTGSTIITITVSDGEDSSSSSFTLNVVPIPNTAPTISAIDDLSITEGDVIQAIEFSIADSQSDSSDLTISANSSNSSLLLDTNISIEGTADTRTVDLNPISGVTGSTIITITVSDGEDSSSSSFTLNVVPNTAPTIEPINNYNLYTGLTVGPIQLLVHDEETPEAELNISVSSSNESVVSEDSIFLSQTDSQKNLILTTSETISGSTTMTITVSDGRLSNSTSFTVDTVRATPSITSQPQSIVETEGNLAIFLVEADGRPELSYQWFFNDIAITNATGTSYAITSVSSENAGSYSVVISNEEGNVESSKVTLTVEKLIPIEQTTIIQKIDSEGQLILTTEEPSDNLTYQWFYGTSGDTTSPIAGATQSSFTPPPSNLEATYWVKVSLDGGITQGIDSIESASIILAATPLDRYYFGEFNSGTGSFGLLVRSDNTAVFLADISTPKTIIATVDMEITPEGEFRYKSTELGWVEGKIEVDRVTGKVAQRNMTFTGALANTDGATSTSAGFYDAQITNTSDGQVYLLAGPDEVSYVLAGASESFSGVPATLNDEGILTLDSPDHGDVTLTLNETNGTIVGTTSIDGKEHTIIGNNEEVIPESILLNTSVRAQAKAGAGAMIAGFVIQGDGEKEVLIRGVGPSLAQLNVSNVIEDTSIYLYKMGIDEAIASNDDWADSANSATIESSTALVGAFELDRNSKDSALLLNLTEGVYSAIVVNNSGSDGTALVEVYDIDEAKGTKTEMELVNISLRGEVSSGENVIIGGFVVDGNSPKRLFIRAMGKELSKLGVDSTLADPQLSLYRTTDDGIESVAFNDSWSEDATLLRESATVTGAFEFEEGSNSAAQVIWLEPGVYTAMASSGDGSSGIALIEVYQLP